jgi:hypothetical protein
LFDVHLGNVGCSKSHLERDIDLIRRDPYSLWVGGGDMMDFVLPGDPRFDPEVFADDFSVRDLTRTAAILIDQLLYYLMPISRKCLAFGYGNHEFQYMKRNNMAFLHDQIVDSLKTQNLRYSGWMDVFFVHDPSAKSVTMRYSVFPPTTFTSRLRVFSHHGAGSPATVGGKINRLKQLVDMVDADLVLTGHLHEQISKPFVRLHGGSDCTEVRQKITMALMTGSYLRNYGRNHTSYAEIKAYFPTTIGASCARYKPSTRELVIENRADNIGSGMSQ